jgi:hypothetical protein
MLPALVVPQHILVIGRGFPSDSISMAKSESGMSLGSVAGAARAMAAKSARARWVNCMLIDLGPSVAWMVL